MAIPESTVESTPAGTAVTGPGWFVLNLAGARGVSVPGHGVYCPFEPPDAEFEHYGINVHVLAPGDRSALYHSENMQEDFLVLAGECIAVVEEQERRLRAWDFLHCPPGTRHALVGAGDGPCAVLMVGARGPGATVHYPVSEAAAVHGLSVPEATDVPRDAYAAANWNRERIPTPMPWPP